MPDGGQYDGPLLKGKFNHSGRIVWPDGSLYDGEFKNSLFHGKGRYKTDDYNYEGDFIEGVAREKGVIVFSNGDHY